jgi:hypothetical protein
VVKRAVVERNLAARLVGVAGVLLLVGVAVAIVALVSQKAPQQRFEATAFRDARLTQDTGVLQTQARLAVEQGVLKGLSAKELRATLGKPTRTYKRTPRMVWQVGGWNASGSLGTKLEVALDDDRQRVVEVWLDPPPEYD